MTFASLARRLIFTLTAWMYCACPTSRIQRKQLLVVLDSSLYSASSDESWRVSRAPFHENVLHSLVGDINDLPKDACSFAPCNMKYMTMLRVCYSFSTTRTCSYATIPLIDDRSVQWITCDIVLTLLLPDDLYQRRCCLCGECVMFLSVSRSLRRRPGEGP